MNQFKVYYEPNRWWSRAFQKICYYCKINAPSNIVFVSDHNKADFQILDVIGPGFPDDIRCHRVVYNLHGFYDKWREDRDFWLPYLNKAIVSFSFADVPGILESNDFRFAFTPWGVDRKIFYPRKKQRTAVIFTSGSCTVGEAIKECREAARIANQPMIHLGPRLECMHEEGIEVISGVSEDELANWLSESRLVSGLRFGSGFELIALEGYACGARPIVFDNPDYRRWYGDIGIFIPELPYQQLIDKIVEIMRQPFIPVSKEEMDRNLEKFDWRKIMVNYWEKIQYSLNIE